jgi:hypothetical protein
MRRLLLASVVSMGLIIPASAIALGVASSPAWASSGVSCAKVKGTVTGTFEVLKCLPTSKTLKKADKSASAPTAKLTGETGGTLTWSKSGQTTTVHITNTSLPGQGACPAKAIEAISTGSVTGGTSTYTHAGDSVSIHLCIKNGKISLVKGTRMTL